ncbi:hypothetical protein D9756_002660 [Leucocoprinus leucothites]|uniref:DNL-type domain-containing protein n=1 Tax=Leucocoprinus leucothites TaxID=201217 RepID=A0A8H5LMC3_9AGAR|nr:hypothetical protein D9756_002660 [Leucoagaricus leucothites]
MLPSRLFRNTGLPPPLRSLLTPSPSLSASYRVQLRFRLGVTASSLSPPSNAIPASRSRYSTTASSSGSSSTTANAEDEATQGTEEQTVFKQALGKIEPKLSITFTCTVEGCGERSTHQFTKHAYEKGIVLVQCPGCKNRHLIADHLGWFKESTEEGKLRTIEDILKAKGENVKRGKIDPNGTIEFT